MYDYETHNFFCLPKPTTLNSIEDIFGSNYIEKNSGNALNCLIRQFDPSFNLEEGFDELYDINSSYWDWISLSEILNHEFMCFYYSALLVNANPDSPEYCNIALLFIKECGGFNIVKIFDNVDSFLEEFKDFEKNKPELNEEYLAKVEEYEQVYRPELWSHWIRSSFSNFLLTKHQLHEEE